MKQAEKIYMISDAAKQVQVEAHVLRYWEEELKVPAKRNEMGHRYYTEEDISKFKRVKELKEQGLQLKAIRHMLKSGNLQKPMLLFETDENNQGAWEERTMPELQTASMPGDGELGKRHVVVVKKGEFLPVDGKTLPVQQESKEQKSFRLQQLLKEMIMEAVQSNNQEICQDIKETLLKELDYQFRLQEEKEDSREEERLAKQEEHYHQIDELLRAYNQRGRRGKKIHNEGTRLKNEGEDDREREQNKEADENENKGIKKIFLRKKRSIV